MITSVVQSRVRCRLLGQRRVVHLFDAALGEPQHGRRDDAIGQWHAGREQVVVNGRVRREIPALVVVVGAERIRSFGVGANEMADLVHQHAASQRRSPAASVAGSTYSRQPRSTAKVPRPSAATGCVENRA